MSKCVTIVRETREEIPPVDFERIARTILGSRYELTVILTTSARIKKLNAVYRGISKPTDILSFLLSGNEGEIYICPTEARKEAKKFDRTYENFLPFLFIHGCVHLKGHDHGTTMERIEVGIRKKFGI